MSFPNPKELKKLADMCRKAGIKHFKSPEFEFTLTDDVPVSNYKKSKELLKSSVQTDNIETDSLSEEELLFWSTGGSIEGN